MPENMEHHPKVHLCYTSERVVGILALLLVSGLFFAAQDSKPQTAAAPAQQSSQASPTLLPPVQLDGAAALHHLNQVINWYRHSTTSAVCRTAQRRYLSGQHARVSAHRWCGWRFSPRRPRARSSQPSRRALQPGVRRDHTAAKSGADGGKDFFSDRSTAIADRKSERANCEIPAAQPRRP